MPGELEYCHHNRKFVTAARVQELEAEAWSDGLLVLGGIEVQMSCWEWLQRGC